MGFSRVHLFQWWTSVSWEIFRKLNLIFLNKLLTFSSPLSFLHFCNTICIAGCWFNKIVEESPELNINLVNSSPISHSSFCRFGLALLSSNLIVVVELPHKTGNHTFVLNEKFCSHNTQKGFFWGSFSGFKIRYSIHSFCR